MEAPYFKIDGQDILPIVADGGIKWQRSDVESSKAGRTMDAVMHRGRVATKFRADVPTIRLYTEKVNWLMNLILPEFVEIETNQHPLYGYWRGYFYSNNIPVTCVHIDKDTGIALWDGITFPLIEQ